MAADTSSLQHTKEAIMPMLVEHIFWTSWIPMRWKLTSPKSLRCQEAETRVELEPLKSVALVVAHYGNKIVSYGAKETEKPLLYDPINY